MNDKAVYPAASSEQSNIRDIALLSILLLATVAAALTRLPIHSLLSSAPPALQNCAKYIYFTDLHARTLGETGAFWGYDPTFGAGYLSGAGWFIGFLFPSILGWLTSLPGAVLVKVLLAFYFLFSPLLTYLGARLFGLSRPESVATGLIILTMDHLTIRSEMIMRGMPTFWLASSLILPAAGLLVWLNRERPRPLTSALIVTAAAILAGSINPHSLLVMAIAFAGVWLWHRRYLLGPVGIIASIFACILIVAALWPWAGPGLKHFHAVTTEGHSLIRFVRMEWRAIASKIAFLVYLQPFTLVLTILGAMQVARWIRRRNPLGLYFGGVFTTILVASAATHISGQGVSFHTIRYVDSSLMFMALPAAVFLREMLLSLAADRRKATIALTAIWFGLLVYVSPALACLLILMGAGVQTFHWLRRKRAVGLAFALLLLAEIVMLIGPEQGQAEQQASPTGYHVGIALLLLPAVVFMRRTLFTANSSRLKLGIVVVFQLAIVLHAVAYHWSKYPTAARAWETGLTTTDDQKEFLALTKWLNENTTPDARVLVESSHNSDAQVLGFDFVGLLPSFVPDREFIALPTTESPGALYSTFLTEGILAWLPIETYTDEKLSEYLRIYNIGWIVASHPKTFERLDKSPAIAKMVAQIGPIRLYAVNQERSFFLKGSGDIEADLNRIELRNLAPDESGNVTIAYHWFASLRSPEGIPIAAEEHPPDPFGFITIHNPPESLTIVNDVSDGFPSFGPSFKRYINSIIERYRELGVKMDVPAGAGIQYEEARSN